MNTADAALRTVVSSSALLWPRIYCSHLVVVVNSKAMFTSVVITIVYWIDTGFKKQAI